MGGLTPVCGCHGVPMGWQKDPRLAAGGRWECREKRREYNATRHAQRVAWLLADYYRSPRQRVSRRRRARAKERERIREQLGRLQEEAACLLREIHGT